MKAKVARSRKCISQRGHERLRKKCSPGFHYVSCGPLPCLKRWLHARKPSPWFSPMKTCRFPKSAAFLTRNRLSFVSPRNLNWKSTLELPSIIHCIKRISRYHLLYEDIIVFVSFCPSWGIFKFLFSHQLQCASKEIEKINNNIFNLKFCIKKSTDVWEKIAIIFSLSKFVFLCR